MAGGGKMKLFKFIQKVNHDIGLIPPESNPNHRRINSKNRLILYSFAQLLIASVAYLLFEANSMTEYGLVFFICTTLVISIIIYLISLWQMKNISNFIENCERFIEKRTHSTIVYNETNEKIERITEYIFDIMIVSGAMLVLPALLYSFVNYYILDAGKESFFLFWSTWWPFDWKTPIGYLLAWFGQGAGTAAITIAGNAFFNILFGLSWIFIVIVEDITNDVAAFNNTVGTLKDRNNRTELMERFRKIVQLYSDAKQFTNEFNKIYEYSLFSIFLWDMLSISSLLVTLQFQLWDDDSKMFETVILSMLILWPFLLNWVVCEPGQRVTDQFDQFGVEFDRCEWNKLSVEMQRMYLIFLSDTQQSKNIRSYAGILCTRDTFKTITTKGFSYFMTLRNFRA